MFIFPPLYIIGGHRLFTFASAAMLLSSSTSCFPLVAILRVLPSPSPRIYVSRGKSLYLIAKLQSSLCLHENKSINILLCLLLLRFWFIFIHQITPSYGHYEYLRVVLVGVVVGRTSENVLEAVGWVVGGKWIIFRVPLRAPSIRFLSLIIAFAHTTFLVSPAERRNIPILTHLTPPLPSPTLIDTFS